MSAHSPVSTMAAPFPVKWKGCIAVTRGTCVDVVEQQDQSTEIVVRGKHWFTDEMPDVTAGACPTTSSAKKQRSRLGLDRDERQSRRRPEWTAQSLFRPNPNPN